MGENVLNTLNKLHIGLQIVTFPKWSAPQNLVFFSLSPPSASDALKGEMIDAKGSCCPSTTELYGDTNDASPNSWRLDLASMMRHSEFFRAIYLCCFFWSKENYLNKSKFLYQN